MNKLTTLLTLMAVFALASGAMAITIDGSRADWDASGLLNADPAGDHAWRSSAGDMTKWGATVENGFVNVFFEDPSMSTFLNASTGSQFSALQMDMDRQGGFTYWGGISHGKTGWDGASSLENRESAVYPEFNYPLALGETGRGYFDGADIWCELSFVDEGFNFWGIGDYYSDMGASVNATSTTFNGPNGYAASGSDFIEYSFSVASAKAEVLKETTPGVRDYPDAITPKKVWKVGVRHATHFASGGTYEGDKSGNGASGADPLTDGTNNYKVWVYLPVETVMGDADEDGSVLLSDLNILKANWQSNLNMWDDGWAVGDFDGDLTVGLSDLNIIKANWQSSFSGGAVTPEPATLGLLVLGLLGLIRRR